jgi:hypothetical protein
LVAFASWSRTPAELQAEVAPAPPVAPGGVHFLEPQLQLGTVPPNEKISGSFTLVNDTSQPIDLCEPFKSCSCADASLDRRSLAPGERCPLTVVIQTGGRRGRRAETVSVIYTDPGGANPRQLIARILFEVKGVFEVDPPQVTLTSAQPKVSFVVRGDPRAERHDVVAVVSNHRCVKVDTRALPVVTLELDLGTPDESILDVECLVYTNNPAEDVIRVPVRVRKE